MSRRSRFLTTAVAFAAAVAVPMTAHAERKYRVQIESTPSGATVYVDSKEDGKVGKTTYRGSLPAGDHTVFLELEGHRPSQTVIKVRKTRKRQKFRVELTKMLTGTVAVSAPSGDAAIGADVRIDGVKIGTVPDEFTVVVGPHQVEIVVNDDTQYEEWVEVKPGETVTIEPELGEPEEVGGGGDEGGGEPPPKVRKRVKVEPPRPTGNVKTAMFVFETGLDLTGRDFSYGGAVLSDNLRPYEANFVPAIYLGVELYPLAAKPGSLASKFGIDASFGRALGLVSATKEENGVMTDVNTDWTQVSVGLRVRHVAGGALLSGGVGYGSSSLEFEDPPDDIADEVPEATYKFVRVGMDGRIGSEAFSVFAGAELLLVSEAGTSAERFRDASTSGFGARAGAAVRIVHQVEARATFRYRLFNSTYTSESGDEFIADTGTDHQYGLLLGGAFVF